MTAALVMRRTSTQPAGGVIVGALADTPMAATMTSFSMVPAGLVMVSVSTPLAAVAAVAARNTGTNGVAPAVVVAEPL